MTVRARATNLKRQSESRVLRDNERKPGYVRFLMVITISKLLSYTPLNLIDNFGGLYAPMRKLALRYRE